MAARCVCCDLPVSSCGKAAETRERDTARALRERLLDEPGVTASRFPGVCVCGERFAAGEPITRDGAGWRALTCCPEPLSR